MKPSLFLLIGLVTLLTQTGLAQPNRTTLATDPVFTIIAARRIQYPPVMAKRAIYGRVWAGFQIDEEGHIQDVSLLYPLMVPKVSKAYGLSYEIEAGLKHMLPLNPRYAGNYLLPVAFCFTHHNESPNPLIPTNQLPTNFDAGDRTLLFTHQLIPEWIDTTHPTAWQPGQTASRFA